MYKTLKKFIVGNVYRHSNSAFDAFKEIFLNVLDLLNKKYYIIGGVVSINLVNRDQRICDYLNCIYSAYGLQFVGSPTRHSANHSSSSLINHVYSRFDCEKLNVNVVEYDVFDHM